MVFRKIFILIRQDLHGTVTDIDQVYQHFYSLATPYHIVAKRPERFLFIVADFDLPSKGITKQEKAQMQSFLLFFRH